MYCVTRKVELFSGTRSRAKIQTLFLSFEMWWSWVRTSCHQTFAKIETLSWRGMLEPRAFGPGKLTVKLVKSSDAGCNKSELDTWSFSWLPLTQWTQHRHSRLHKGDNVATLTLRAHKLNHPLSGSIVICQLSRALNLWLSNPLRKRETHQAPHKKQPLEPQRDITDEKSREGNCRGCGFGRWAVTALQIRRAVAIESRILRWWISTRPRLSVHMWKRREGGRTPDRAGTSRRAGEPDPHPIHMMFRLCTDWSHTASGQLRVGIRLALGWDVPHAFVFLRNMGCSIYFCLYRMFHVLFFLLHMGCSMCFCLYRMFHVLLFFLLNTGCSTCFCFLLNTGCSACFWFFAKQGMFHVLLFIQDVLCAFVFCYIWDVLCAFVFCKTWDVPCAFIYMGCSMCFSFFSEHRMFHVLLFFCKTWDVPCAFIYTGCSICALVFLLNTGCSMCFYLYGMSQLPRNISLKFKPDQSSARFIRSSCILISLEPDRADQPNQVCVTP